MVCVIMLCVIFVSQQPFKKRMENMEIGLKTRITPTQDNKDETSQ